MEHEPANQCYWHDREQIVELRTIEGLGNGAPLIRMTAVDLFHGDVGGEARAEFVALGRADNSSGFSGFYLFSGTAEGRHGSFALRTTGTGAAAGPGEGSWAIKPGSTVESLERMTGTGGFSHQRGVHSSLWLDYRTEE